MPIGILIICFIKNVLLGAATRVGTVGYQPPPRETVDLNSISWVLFTGLSVDLACLVNVEPEGTTYALNPPFPDRNVGSSRKGLPSDCIRANSVAFNKLALVVSKLA